MRLKLVVLPAPFGPISATVSPSLTEKPKSWTARSPPNRLLKLRMTSASAIEHGFPLARRSGRDQARVSLRHKAEQSARPPQDHHDQDQAIDRQLHAAVAA